MTHTFFKNLPMLLAGVVLGVAAITWGLWGYDQLSLIDSITIMIERPEEYKCHP